MLGGSTSTTRARDARRAAGAARPQAVDELRWKNARTAGAAAPRRRRVGRQAGERAAAVEAREDQHADLVAVDAGDHDVLHARVAGGDDLRAQRADRDEGAGRELEVLGDAAVEHEAALRVAPGRRLDGVAAAVEALVVERLGRLLGRAPVARRDVRPAVAHLELVAGRHELQLDAGRGQADVARLHLVGVGADRERRGLGHAEAGEHADALAAVRLRRRGRACPRPAATARRRRRRTSARG